MHGCCWLVAALLCWLATVWGQQDDSLRGALEAISRRQRDLADSGYYINRGVGRLHVRPDDDIQFYDSRNGFQEGGQPEDIGYGYQKSVAPHTSGLFEPVPMPSSELGSHDNNFGNIHFSEKELERLVSDFPRGDVESSRFAYTFPTSRLPSSVKKSIFRERGDASSPDVLQNLYSKHDSDADVNRAALVPSSFRERLPGRPVISPSVLALVRRFGGLGRDSENGPSDDDSDEYLTELNSIWEKYKSNGPDGFDPEELSESDVEELMKYFGNKQDKKRYDSYGNSYDYFNSPLNWNKRSRQNLESPAVNNGFFHALKFLSKNRDVLESMHDEDDPNEDEDEDVAKLLSEPLPSFGQYAGRNAYIDSAGYTQKPRHDTFTFNPYPNRISKRFPVTKRSSSNYGDHEKHVSHSDNKRLKKNVGDGDITDPKVAQEINNIFSTPGNEDKGKKGNINEPHLHNSENVLTNNTEGKIVEKSSESSTHGKNTSDNSNKHAHHMHRRDKDVGQKEESNDNSYAKPLQVKKKSIDWSNYFGIDRRRKKSVDKNTNDEWLLNQYLKAYSLSGHDPNQSNELFSKVDRKQQTDYLSAPNDDETPKGPDDIDDKLRAMEDIIVDEALKYTGAHEGITDSKEIQKVKDRVMTKLAAAYSLEKMRRALGEFKSSMEAQKETSQSQTSTPKPEDKEDQKDKRVAVKKEKAELNVKEKKLEKKSEDNNVNYPLTKPILHSVDYKNYIQNYQDDDVCPLLRDLAIRCKQINVFGGAESDVLLPVCTYHQICSMCGLGYGQRPNCDNFFLAEASAVCHDNAQCRFAAGRMLVGLRSLRGTTFPDICDWDNNPCVARFLFGQ